MCSELWDIFRTVRARTSSTSPRTVGNGRLVSLLVALHPRSVEYPADDQHIDEKNYPKGYATYMRSLYAQLGARGASTLSGSGDDSVGGHCVHRSGKVQFVPSFPASCKCGNFSRFASSTQARVQVVHHTATVSRVPGSLASAERRTGCRRSRRVSPATASRTTLSARAVPRHLVPDHTVGTIPKNQPFLYHTLAWPLDPTTAILLLCAVRTAAICRRCQTSACLEPSCQSSCCSRKCIRLLLEPYKPLGDAMDNYDMLYA